MAGEHGIKETMEFLNGLEVLVVGVMDIAKDGFDLTDDLPKLVGLAAEASKLSDAITDVKMAKDELMEVDVEEAKELIERLYQMAAAIAEVRK